MIGSEKTFYLTFIFGQRTPRIHSEFTRHFHRFDNMTLLRFDQLITIFYMSSSIYSTPQSAIIVRYRRLCTTAVSCAPHFVLEQRILISLYT